MKIRILFVIAAFLISFSFFPVDSYAKGGGKGGGGRGGKSTHRSGFSHKGGHHGHPKTGFYYFRGAFFLGGYDHQIFGDSPRGGCYSCHPSLSWFDKFRSCKYRNLNSRKAAEHRAMLEKFIRNQADERLRTGGP